MSGVDPEYEKGVCGLDDNDKYPYKGGVEAVGVRIFLQSHCPVSVSLRCGYVGGYPLHGKGTGGFPRPGGATTDREDSTAVVGR